MTSVDENLLSEITRICDDTGHSEKTKTILNWFIQECMTSGSRIDRSELKNQLIRLGKELEENQG